MGMVRRNMVVSGWDWKGEVRLSMAKDRLGVAR